MKLRVLFKFVFVCCAVFVFEAVAGDGFSPGIEELYRLDRLPAFKGSVAVASQSSYDRTGGNNDGFGGEYSYVRKEDGGLVLGLVAAVYGVYAMLRPFFGDRRNGRE